MQIYTHYSRPRTRYRECTGKKLVIPDQTISLKTMVSKYVRGLPISAPNFNGTYTDDESACDFKKLDLAEQEEIILERSAELSEIKQKKAQQDAEQSANQRKEAEKREAELKELREFKNKISINNP